MRLIALLALIFGGAPVIFAQPQSAQVLFESGQYDEAMKAIEQSGPSQAFLAGQILLKLGRTDDAKNEFQRLAKHGEQAWQRIGQSAIALAENDVDRALDSARQAVSSSPGSFEAQYQLGLVLAKRENWKEAAEAFSRATAANPTFAYAHYYAGLSYSRDKRADLTAEHFERFLKLAPRAPERPAVESMMRTLRGK